MKYFLGVLLLFTASVFSQSICLDFPAVKMSGDSLVINDGTNRRFFLAGMVDNSPSNGKQLSGYDHDKMDSLVASHRLANATALRWNAFLKGLDFTWDSSGYVSGLIPGSFSALRDGLDLAEKHGILIQIVLSTAHFAKFGWGGEDNVINGIRNGDRVANNVRMISTEQGIQAYLDNVLNPMIDSIGQHKALFGYVIVNEAYGMIHPDDTPNGAWSDEYIRLSEMRRFVNRVAGVIHRRQPGALTTVSGISKLNSWWDDSLVVSAGGDADGTLDLHQYQYYPDNHKESYSPFQNSSGEMLELWPAQSKPSIAGEFLINGQDSTDKNSIPLTLEESYETLWQLGYSGGFTWSSVMYESSTDAERDTIEEAYLTLYEKHLKGIGLWEIDCTQMQDSSTSVLGDLESNSYPVEARWFDLKGREIDK